MGVHAYNPTTLGAEVGGSSEFLEFKAILSSEPVAGEPGRKEEEGGKRMGEGRNAGTMASGYRVKQNVGG